MPTLRNIYRKSNESMVHLRRFEDYTLPKFEAIGGMRGPFGLPNKEDITDIVKGFSKREILKWTPPRTVSGARRIALSDTEKMLSDKKIEIMRQYNCPEEWYYKVLTFDDIKCWKDYMWPVLSVYDRIKRPGELSTEDVGSILVTDIRTLNSGQIMTNAKKFMEKNNNFFPSLMAALRHAYPKDYQKVFPDGDISADMGDLGF